MDRPGLVALSLALVVLLPAGGAAQECLGVESFRQSRVRVQTSFASYTYADALSLEAASGGRLFFSAGVGMTRDPELDAQTIDVRAEVGYTLHVGHHPGLTICPLLAYVINFGPYDLLLYDLDHERRAIELGLGAGTVVRLREGRLRLVPALHVRRVDLTLHSRARLWAEPDITQSFSSSHWIVGGAIGIIVSERLTVRPGISILGGFPAEGSRGYLAVPFGREEWEKSLNITIAIAMWRRSEGSAVQRR